MMRGLRALAPDAVRFGSSDRPRKAMAGMYSGEHAEKKRGMGRSILSFVLTIAVIVAIAWGLRTFVFQAYEIPSGSMEDTIMTGDMVFSEKLSYYAGSPEQGDIITFKDPEIPSRTPIKRVIATEGQTVQLIDGKVYVDGRELDEPYTDGKETWPLTSSYGLPVEYPYKVPEGEVWVMGDNRTNSQDSRYFGSIPVSSVTGKAVFTYWPLDSIGMLE